MYLLLYRIGVKEAVEVWNMNAIIVISWKLTVVALLFFKESVAFSVNMSPRGMHAQNSINVKNTEKGKSTKSVSNLTQ